MYRDFYDDPNMHGLDWPAMRAKYEPLVDWMAHRTDLDFVLGELVGEVNSGHTYVESSEDWKITRRESGLLGAEIVADPSGHFRVARIFPGENWHEDTRSPLTEPGVHVKEGDLILAVDGESTKGVDNFYRLLEGKADRVVTLRVAAAAGGSSRDERVRPIKTETSLRYLDWVAQRRKMVDQLSGGRIGYIHVPNTAVEGNRELFKGFYAQSNKDALILDDRYNGGGFIPFQMIQLLERPLLSYWAQRDQAPLLTPQFVARGPKVVLTNGYAGSGGDAFPYYFRERHLGQLIGTRTWGGLIGLNGNPGFMDGGGVEVPVFRFIDPTTGKWAVEGEGVSPDIEVVDRPDLVARGHDPSLEKAVQVLLDELQKSPPKPLTIPAPPAPEAGARR
jgi:tricorn protease